MKVIKKDDLLLVLSMSNKSSFDLDDLSRVLNLYGDDYFIEGNRFVQTTVNKNMAFLREQNLKGENK